MPSLPVSRRGSVLQPAAEEMSVMVADTTAVGIVDATPREEGAVGTEGKAKVSLAMPALDPLISASIPLVPLMAFMEGGARVADLSVRVNASAVSLADLSKKAGIRGTVRTKGFGSVPIKATANSDPTTDDSGNRTDDTAKHVLPSAIPALADDEDGGGDLVALMQPPVLTVTEATRAFEPEATKEGGEDATGRDGQSPPPTASSGPEQRQGSLASGLDTIEGGMLSLLLPSRYGERNHEDSVQFDRGSIASPLPPLYTPIVGDQSVIPPVRAMSAMDNTTSAAVAALRLLGGGGSSANGTTRRDSASVLGTIPPSSVRDDTERGGEERSLLDCLVENPLDGDGHDLRNVLGAISFALHRSTEHGALYAKAVRGLYSVDTPSTTHKNKMPLDKLFRCLAKPGVLYEGVALEFLIVEEAVASDGLGACRRPSMLGHGPARTAFYSYAAEIIAAKATRRVQAKSRGYEYARGDAVDVTDTKAVLVCLHLRRPKKGSPYRDAAAEFVDAFAVQDGPRGGGDAPAPTASWSAMRCDTSLWSPSDDYPMLPMVSPEELLAISGRAADVSIRKDAGNSGKDVDVYSVTTTSTSDSSNSDDDSTPSPVVTPRRNLQDSRRTVLAGGARLGLSEHSVPGKPFSGLFYPTLDGGDAGFLEILVRSLHRRFVLNRIRLPSTMLCLIIVLALASAVLHIVMHTFDACCVPVADLTDTDDRMCVYNLTQTGVSEMLLAQCEVDMCYGGSGRLSAALRNAYVWGTMLSSGRLLVIGIALSIVTMLLTLLVSFFATRPLAVGSTTPRFFIVPYLLQLLAGGLMVAGGVWMAVDFFEPNHVVKDCEIYGKGSQMAALCHSEYDNCDVKFVVRFDGNAGEKALPWLCIVMAFFTVVQLIFSLIPPLLSAHAREGIAPAVPDTMIFKVGRYAPDGITEEEVIELQQAIRARWRKERFHRMVRAAVDDYAQSKEGRSDQFVGKGAASAASFNLRSAAEGKQSARLVKVARLLMGANRFKKAGAMRALRYHHPDPNAGGAAPQVPAAMLDAIEAISEKVLVRMREGTARNNFAPVSAVPSTAKVLVAPEGDKRATVWDVLTFTTNQVIKEERDGRSAGKTRGWKMFQTVTAFDTDKVEACVHEDTLQHRVLENIATRLACEALADGDGDDKGPTDVPAGGRSSVSAAGRSKASGSIYPLSMMVEKPRLIPDKKNPWARRL